MIGFSLSQLEAPLHARRLGDDVSFSSVSTDTRTLRPGDLFVALSGPNFDGHDYTDRALEQGAVGAMLSRLPARSLPCLVLPDTRKGLAGLANLWRRTSGATLVAITGSNGKTTVKEMVAAILRQGGAVLATQGNLNNDIGVPLTLLRLQDEPYAVVEMGASHGGEIANLSRLAQPDVALLNNAGSAHLEGFGSLQGVARAKAEILSGLSSHGRFVFNADDAWAPLWRELAGQQAISTFGVRQPADVSSSENALELRWNDTGFRSHFPVSTPDGDLDIELALPGAHNQMNALAAIAAVQALGVARENIEDGLRSLQPVPGRLQSLAGRDGVGLIDDSYNANPDSVKAAIDVLATAPGRRILVLGELAEMGPMGAAFYREIGRYAQAKGLDRLYTLGAAEACNPEFGRGAVSADGLPRLIDILHQELSAGDRVLVKGSRSARMEQVVLALAAGEVN